MLKKIFLPLFCLLCSGYLFAQQVPDHSFSPQVDRALYTTGKGPVIGIDGAHHNLHQLEGGFGPFASLARADGYQAVAVDTLSRQVLESLDILVIANPLHTSNVGNWKNPVPSAFSEEEISLIEDWVRSGGSLLSIADHMPYGGAAASLAAKFGFTYENGFVVSQQRQWPPEMYRKSEGTLNSNVFTIGVDSLAGFTGSALLPHKEALIVGAFPPQHRLLLPEVAWEFDENTPEKPLENYVMGAAMPYGKGKVAFFTEAAMFTAQIVQDKYKVGFNSDRAPDNQRFVRNVLHWLDKDSPESKVYENLRAMGEAYEADEMGIIARLYTSDAIIYKPSGEEVVGREAIEAYWQGLKGRTISWNCWLLDVEQAGDQIIAVFRLDMAYRNHKNEAHTSPTKAMLVYKEEEGTYKLYRDFYTAVRK
jgi:ketosteroid isomerase-like protein